MKHSDVNEHWIGSSAMNDTLHLPIAITCCYGMMMMMRVFNAVCAKLEALTNSLTFSIYY